MTSNDDARTARRRDQLTAIHDRLVDAVERLTDGDAWQHMLRVAARMPHYSFNNVLLVAAQRPDATAVAGYRAWAAVGRQVRKGEKGIAILAPCLYRADVDLESEPASAESSMVLRGFRVVHVFDIAQTDGPPAPDAPELLRGDAPASLWEQLERLVIAHGCALERGDCHGANGFTDYGRRVVRVRSDVDTAQAVKTLAHELGHIRADHEHRYTGTKPPATRCRGMAEVEAESIAFVVLAFACVDTAPYSVPYVAGWSEGNAAHVRATAELVTSCAAAVVQDLGPSVVRVDTGSGPATAHRPGAQGRTMSL